MPRLLPLNLLAGSIAVATSLSLLADEIEWPGWRGPARDGWVASFQPPAQWPARLQKTWQIAVGTGYSSPIAADGSVFQHARQGEDEVVWRVDLGSGKVQWRRSYSTPFKMGNGGERHGKGPKSSPVFADGRLFTMSITGVLSAWDANFGDLIWRRDYAGEFEGGHPYWGAATSPLIDGDKVIAHVGTDGRGALVALNTTSGKEIWRHGDAGPAYSSPILVELHGVRQVVEWNDKALLGIESESGRLLWQHSFPQVNTDQNMPTPALFDGLILLGAENRGIHAFEPIRENGVWTVSERWHQEDVALDMSSAVINGDLLFGFSHYDTGRIFCVDPATGDILWQGPRRTGENVAFLAMPDYVAALISNGVLRFIEATGSAYESVATYEIADSPTWAPLVLLGESILIKDDKLLTRWSFASDAETSIAR